MWFEEAAWFSAYRRRGRVLCLYNPTTLLAT
uniref:Uncharacterized protein n=1 Tax=Anguilla anguilla TaxID=7936 RepID=A0A0E9QG30_ANGAN